MGPAQVYFITFNIKHHMNLMDIDFHLNNLNPPPTILFSNPLGCQIIEHKTFHILHSVKSSVASAMPLT